MIFATAFALLVVMPAYSGTSGDDAETVLKRTYASAAAILENVIALQKSGDDEGPYGSVYGTLYTAFDILEELADTPVTDSANRGRCAALMTHILTNYYLNDAPATLLFELPPDYLDKHHAELHEALTSASFEKDAYMENVLGVYAMLPSCDVAFATNKAQEIKSWPLIRAAILARHGDQAALLHLQHVANTFMSGMGFSYEYLCRILALVRTKPMVEFLVRGLYSDDTVAMPEGVHMPRYALYHTALQMMFRYASDFPSNGTSIQTAQWCAKKYNLSLPKELPIQEDRIFVSACPAPPSATNAKAACASE